MQAQWAMPAQQTSPPDPSLERAGLERAESNFMRRSSSAWSDFFRRPSSTFGLSRMSSTFSRMSSTFSRPASSFMVPAGVDLTPTIGRTASVAVGGPVWGGDSGFLPLQPAPERVASTWAERTASVASVWAERTASVVTGVDRTGSVWPQRVASVVPSVPVWGQVPQGTTQIDVDQAIAQLFPQSQQVPASQSVPQPFWVSSNGHDGGGGAWVDERATRPPLDAGYTQQKAVQGQPPLKRGNSAKNAKDKSGKTREDNFMLQSDSEMSETTMTEPDMTVDESYGGGGGSKAKKGVASRRNSVIKTGATAAAASRTGAAAGTASTCVRKQWTPEEEAKFLKALDKLGPKDTETDPRTGRVSVRLGPGVAEIISLVVGSRSVAQVRSHAQKHYIRKEREASRLGAFNQRE